MSENWWKSLPLAMATLASVGAAAWWMRPAPPELPPSLATIESMGHLVSVRVRVADIVDFTLPRSISVPGFGNFDYAGTSLILIAKGDCSIASDLRLAKQRQVNSTAKTLTIEIPSPRLLDARVDHSKPESGGSRIFKIENNGLEPFIPDGSNRTQAVDEAYRKAEAIVAAACTDKARVEVAKKNTEALLSAMYRAAGWNPSFKWL
jgi:hypothetical protein